MKIIVIVLILGILVDGISASKDARSDLEQSRGFLTNAIGGAINLLTSVGTGIATSIQQAVSNIGNVITQKVNQATQSAGSTINQIIQVHKDVHNKTASTIQNIANEVLHGVNTHVTITKNLTEAVATALANHIKKTMQTTNITLGGVVSIVETVIDAGHKHLEILLKGATNHTAIIVESVGDLVKGLVSALNATKIGQLHHLPNLLLAGVTDILTHLVNSTVSLTKVNSTKILMSAFVKTAGNVVDSLINVLLLVTNKTGNATKHNFGHSTTALLQSFAGLFDNLADITKEILNGTKIILVDKFVNKTDALVQVVSNIADLITDPAISFTESLVDKLNITSTILVDKIHDVFGAIFNISTDAVEKIVDGVHKTVNGTAVTLLSKIPKFQRLVTNTTTKLAAILNDKIKKHNSTLLAIMSKIGNNGTKLMDKSLASIGKMLGNITTGFQNILFTTKNALMNVTKTLGGTITSVAKGVIQLANNVTKKLGDFVAGKLDCAADLLPNVVKTVQGLGNHTVGCAVSKLSHVLGHVVQNTTALAGVTGKVFTGLPV
ncbi:perilipin-4-like [Phlebotomus argentipes]|uniref:perilipin-4-like n=1 Tax=Phlebotomus argentipes TaxID=94469 RepID=UPI002892C022|nr:perilipin-4-like [Phlebotomus argentipes]